MCACSQLVRSGLAATTAATATALILNKFVEKVKWFLEYCLISRVTHLYQCTGAQCNQGDVYMIKQIIILAGLKITVKLC